MVWHGVFVLRAVGKQRRGRMSKGRRRRARGLAINETTCRFSSRSRRRRRRRRRTGEDTLVLIGLHCHEINALFIGRRIVWTSLYQIMSSFKLLITHGLPGGLKYWNHSKIKKTCFLASLSFLEIIFKHYLSVFVCLDSDTHELKSKKS